MSRHKPPSLCWSRRGGSLATALGRHSSLGPTSVGPDSGPAWAKPGLRSGEGRPQAVTRPPSVASLLRRTGHLSLKIGENPHLREEAAAQPGESALACSKGEFRVTQNYFVDVRKERHEVRVLDRSIAGMCAVVAVLKIYVREPVCFIAV